MKHDKIRLGDTTRRCVAPKRATSLTAMILVTAGILGAWSLAAPNPARATNYTISSNAEFAAYFGFSPSVHLQPGDTVSIAAGTYNPPVENPSYQNILLWNLHGRPGTGGWITIRAADCRNDVNLNLTGLGLGIAGSSYIRLENITIGGAGLDATVQSDHGSNHDIQIVGDSVHDSPGAGISVNGSQSLIEYCTIWNCCHTDPSGDSGIDVYEPVLLASDNTHFASDNNELGNTRGYSLIIRSNTIWYNQMQVNEKGYNSPIDGNGIILDDFAHTQNPGTPYTGKTMVANNVVAFNGAAGICLFHTANVDILNNTCYHNCSNANNNGSAFKAEIWAGESESRNDVACNNICISGGPGYDEAATQNNNGAQCRFDNNLYSYHDSNPNNEQVGPHDRFGAPLFVSTTPGSADFHIPVGSGSPAIGHGRALRQINDDRDGSPRFIPYDIGAYQDHPAAPTNLKATGAAGMRKITLTWGAGRYASGYTVYRAASSGGSYALVSTVSGASYTNTGLTAGKTIITRSPLPTESDSAKIGHAGAKAQ